MQNILKKKKEIFVYQTTIFPHITGESMCLERMAQHLDQTMGEPRVSISCTPHVESNLLGPNLCSAGAK